MTFLPEGEKSLAPVAGGANFLPVPDSGEILRDTAWAKIVLLDVAAHAPEIVKQALAVLPAYSNHLTHHMQALSSTE